METYEAICSRRTIREFKNRPVPYELLEKFVNAGRLAPQAANRQPLEFVIVDDEELSKFFSNNTKLAGYMDWEPSVEKRAPAYIVVLANKEIQKPAWIHYDAALASENISLAAWDQGVGSCLIGAFNKPRVMDILGIPEKYEITLLVALGYPDHKSVEEKIEGDDIKYWRDKDGTFHVPKRQMGKITHHNKF